MEVIELYAQQNKCSVWIFLLHGILVTIGDSFRADKSGSLVVENCAA